MKKLEDMILTYKDFPKKGIDFKDVLEILKYPDIFQKLILIILILQEKQKFHQITVNHQQF